MYWYSYACLHQLLGDFATGYQANVNATRSTMIEIYKTEEYLHKAL